MGWWGCNNHENDSAHDLMFMFTERYYRVVNENDEDSDNDAEDSDNYDEDSDDDYQIQQKTLFQDPERFNKLNSFLNGNINDDYHIGLCFLVSGNFEELPVNFDEKLRTKIVKYLELRINDDHNEFSNPNKRKEALFKELWYFSRGTRGFDDV
jgi:hypothetical protein